MAPVKNTRPTLPPDVAKILRASGWSESRSMTTAVEKRERALSPEFVLFPAARDALLRFGGIRVEQEGPGRQWARETFDLDPSLASGEEDRFASFEGIVAGKLYPLGEAGGGHVFLAISERGEVYALMHDIWYVGRSVEDAIERLVLGLDQPKLS